MSQADNQQVAPLTPARRRALAVLAAAPGFEARESNQTGSDSHDRPVIYWQSRAWLEEKGLIEATVGQPGWYALTAVGVERARSARLLGP